MHLDEWIVYRFATFMALVLTGMAHVAVWCARRVNRGANRLLDAADVCIDKALEAYDGWERG